MLNKKTKKQTEQKVQKKEVGMMVHDGTRSPRPRNDTEAVFLCWRLQSPDIFSVSIISF